MIIDEMKIENTVVRIHDDYIASEEELEEIVKRLSVLAFNHQMQEKTEA